MRIVRVLGTVVLWLLQILMAVAVVLIGVVKFADLSWARNFARWGYPDGFYMVIGVLEAAGGLAPRVPRLTVRRRDSALLREPRGSVPRRRRRFRTGVAFPSPAI